MNIKLNLLPQKRKRNLDQKKKFHFVVWQEIWLIFVLVVFWGTILGLKITLNIQLNSLNEIASIEGNQKEYEKLAQYEKTFNQVNNHLKKIEKIQRNNIVWGKSLRELSQIIPEKVFLKSLESDELLLFAKGTAVSRGDLVALKNNIEKSNCFSRPDIPLSDIVAKNNIEFELKFEVKKDCLAD